MKDRENPILKKNHRPASILFEKSEKRRTLDALKVSNAAKQIQRIPGKSETLHCIMSGNYDGFDIVNGILTLVHPATIKRLDIATLGFNKRNAAELITLMDAGKIQHTTFICCVFYKAHEPGVFQGLKKALADRGCPMIAIRSHCKIMLIETTAGDFLAYESSANLRSCRMIEQFTLTNSRPVVDFHRTWMAEKFNDGEE
jgi:hypothetical protein